jgi:hypothetical protein
LDRLPQLEGGQATLHRRAPFPADYSDFINDATPLSNGHQGLMAPPTWSGEPRHQKGTEPSKLPGSAHLSALSTWSCGPGFRKGTEPSELPSSAHLFALSTWSGGLGHRMGTESSKLPGSAHPSGLSTWSGGLGNRMGAVSSKLPSSSHPSVFSTWSGGLGHWMGMESSKLPDPSPLFNIAATSTNNTASSAITHKSRSTTIHAHLISTLRGWAQQGGCPR